MNAKLIVALVLVALAAAVQSNKIVAPHHDTAHQDKKELTSADVEAKLDPTVQSLVNGQHKLTYKDDKGAEQCLVCQPFQGCGCRDVVAIRCELKRLKQKLLRLKRIAHPHKRSHHGRDEEEHQHIHPVKPVVDPKPVVAVLPVAVPKPVVAVLPVAVPKPVVAVQPAAQPVVKVEPKPAVLVKPVAEPAILVKPAPAVLVKPVAQAAILVAEKEQKPVA